MVFSTFFCCLLTITCCLIISEAAGAKVRSSKPHEDLLFLSRCSAAQSHCSAYYRLPTVTVTVTAAHSNYSAHYPLPTVTVTVTAAAAKLPQSIVSTTKIAAEAAGNHNTLSSVLSSAKAISTTAYSSIETPQPKPVIVPPRFPENACNPDQPQPTFYLRAVSSGTTDDGSYAHLSNYGESDFVTFANDSAAATTFTFNDACNLVGFNGEIANTGSGVVAETIYFNQREQVGAISPIPPVPATCNIANGLLACSAQLANIFYVCSASLQLQIAVAVPTGCSAVRLKPILSRRQYGEAYRGSQ